jgi:hypothetical protein
MSRNIVLFVALSCALLPSASAQSGPWTDGEILVQAPATNGVGLSLYRIAPETGHGEALISGFSGYGGWAGRIAFDPYRNALLVNLALPPDGFFTYELWAVNYDGTKAVIPGFNGATLRGLAPTGDGRVYFQHHNTSPINYLDAANVVHTLTDAANAPFPFPVEHMIFHAPSNSLIASTSAWWSTNDCNAVGSSLFRIPLSADGSQVAGPVVCGSTTSSGAEEVMSLDYLPGGDLLVTLSAGVIGFGPDKLISADPWTLAVSGWAHPAQTDLNGGCYSSRIGKAVVLDDGANELRTFVPGQNNVGTTLVCDVPLGDGSTGFSPAESMWELDVNGPGCVGLALPFGAGLPGTGGVTPVLAVVGCPDINSVFTISIDDVVGGASGLMIASTTPAAIPFFGGTLYVDPIQIIQPVTVSGTPPTPGAGSYGLPILATDPSVIGLTLFIQAGFLDAGAAQGVSLTNGLQLVIG